MADKMMRMAGRGDDGLAKALRVDNSGMLQNLNNSKKIVTTVIDNVTIPAGGDSGLVNIGADGTEDEVYLAVVCNKKPWTLVTNTIFGSYSEKALYPIKKDVDLTYSNSIPSMALVLGIVPSIQLLNDPTSLEEAKQTKLPLDNTINCKLTNNSNESATVTIKTIRVWG